MPCCSIRAVSIAVAQKSPLFCASLPVAAFVAAACSLILRRFTYSCSRTSLPIPHVASDAGIGCRFSQPPFAYWKKSTAGLTVVSRSAARKSPEAGVGAEAAFLAAGVLHAAVTTTTAEARILFTTLVLRVIGIPGGSQHYKRESRRRNLFRRRDCVTPRPIG